MLKKNVGVRRVHYPCEVKKIPYDLRGFALILSHLCFTDTDTDTGDVSCPDTDTGFCEFSASCNSMSACAMHDVACMRHA